MQQRLFEAIGVTEASVAAARSAMGRQMRAEGDAFIDEAARRTLELPGYRELDIAVVRPNTERSMMAVLATLEGGEMSLFGDLLRDIAYQRAREGVSPRSFYELSDITEEMLLELAHRCMSEAAELLSAGIVARRIADGARSVIIDGFQRAHFETRADVERLVSQFSAPLLPALPGVLVLPIVGAISPARADQIVEVMLDGVTRHAAHTVILDITGITDVDATLPVHLRRAVGATRLLGAQVILVGVKPAIARTLVDAGLELGDLRVQPTLAAALLATTSARG
jgi:rsbT co-antagonist protein RsbR